MRQIVVNSKGRISRTGVEKSVADVLSVQIDYTLFFGSDTASTLTVTADDGLTVNSSSVIGNVVTAILSSGSDGCTYDVKVKLTGTTETKEVIFQVTTRDYDADNAKDYQA